jgi:hypothetical protein
LGLRRTLWAASLPLCLQLGAPVLLPAVPDKPVWPLTLREGLPVSLPGYAAAPTDTLPDESENEMGPSLFLFWGQTYVRVQVKAGDDYRVRVPTR